MKVIVSVIFLIISLIIMFGIYNLLIQKQQIQISDKAFMQNLSEAASCFAVDYTKFDEEDKIYYYMKAGSDLHYITKAISNGIGFFCILK